MKLIICILGFTAMALAGDEELFKQANNKFTAKMFHEVSTDSKNVGKSVVLSAFSVMSPLAQIALASVGASHDEILTAIALPNDEVTKNVFTSFNEQFRSIPGVELTMANHLYIASNAEVNQEFAALSNNVFNSEVSNIDFSKSSTVNEINAWVEDHTNNKIKDLLPPNSVDASTQAVLVNAIYFKGNWLNKFEKANTVDRDFHLSKQETVKVPTMQTSEVFKYGESAELRAKLLELPYSGGQSSCLIVLPNEVDGIARLQEKLKDASLLQAAVAQMRRFDVDVRLPKFKIETETNLKEILQKMNISKMFNPGQAKLDNLLQNSKNMFISDAIQKAFIEVNEEGSEAAAANDITISMRFGETNDEDRYFYADRPFSFALKHGTKTLFNGIYVT